MTAFVLIHGAADVGWYWHLVERELRAQGHETIASDLPCADDAAGIAEYADTVVRAAGRLLGSDLVVVGQSFGGFTAPLAAARLRARAIVLVTGMIPAPGEKPEDWPANTGLWQAVAEQGARDGGKTGSPMTLSSPSITTFPVTWPSRPWPGEAGRSRTRRAAARGRSAPGPRYPPGSCCAPRTASSRPGMLAGHVE
ncbi:MAG: alpha/beta fold hydrolase, partial [Trebonia sp.]